MYHFGMLITNRNMRPLPQTMLEEVAPKLKARYNDLGCACAVFVLTTREYPADVGAEFGFPVNVVVTADHHPGWVFLFEQAYEVLEATSCEIFSMPHMNPTFFDDKLDGMRFDTKPSWLKYMTEADHVSDTAASVEAHRDLANTLTARLAAAAQRLSDDPVEQAAFIERMDQVAMREVRRLFAPELPTA